MNNIFLWHEFEVPILLFYRLVSCLKNFMSEVIFLPNLTVAILAIFVEIEQSNGSVLKVQRLLNAREFRLEISSFKML